MAPQMVARSPISPDRGTRFFFFSWLPREGAMEKNEPRDRRRGDRRVVHTEDREPRDGRRNELSPDDGFVKASVGHEEEQRQGEMDA
jgi:hypothetical protein